MGERGRYTEENARGEAAHAAHVAAQAEPEPAPEPKPAAPEPKPPAPPAPRSRLGGAKAAG